MAEVSTSFIISLKGHRIELEGDGNVVHQIVVCDNEAWAIYQELRIYFDRSVTKERKL